MRVIRDAMFDEKPDDVTVYPTSVDVLVSAELVEIHDDMTGDDYEKWKCTLNRYETGEYIDNLQKANDDMANEITSTQVAVAEVYELVVGGGEL